MRLKLKYGKLLSRFAFKSNLRRYTSGVKQPARQFLDVALMPFGVLRFRSVFTVGL